MDINTEKQIAKLYASGATYFRIWEETGVSASTASAMIKRKYPALTKLKAMAKKQAFDAGVQKITSKHDVDSVDASCMYSEMKQRFENKRQAAKVRGIPFTVQFEDLSFPPICPVLGIKLDYFSLNCRDDAYPTFDRKDNNLPYTPENTVVISWRANRIKNNGTAEEHALIAKYMRGPQD